MKPFRQFLLQIGDNCTLNNFLRNKLSYHSPKLRLVIKAMEYRQNRMYYKQKRDYQLLIVVHHLVDIFKRLAIQTLFWMYAPRE